MICKSPECRKQIGERKSAKRWYCNDRCKNRAAYIRRLEKDKHIILFDKKMKKNYRILESLKKKELGPIGLQLQNNRVPNLERSQSVPRRRRPRRMFS